MKDDRGKLDLTKRIEQLELQNRFLGEQLQFAADKIKNLNESNARLVEENSNFLMVNESHRKLNGELQARVKRLEKLLQEYEDKNVC